MPRPVLSQGTTRILPASFPPSIYHQTNTQDPRGKPKDDDRRGGLRQPPALEICIGIFAFVIRGLAPLVSGSTEVEGHLPFVEALRWRRLGFEGVNGALVHEVETHESGEGERLVDGGLSGLCGAQEEIGDQGDKDLDAHGISEVPRKWRSFRFCLIHLKNSSICQRCL